MPSPRLSVPRAASAALAALLLAAPVETRAQPDSSYRQHEAAAAAAMAQRDFADARRQAGMADSALGSHPRTTLALARAELGLGHKASALSLLEAFAATGLAAALDADTAFAAGLRGEPRWDAVRATVVANSTRVESRGVVAFTLPEADFIAEDIAWDGVRRRFLVSSVRQGAIIALGSDGRASSFVIPRRDGPLSILGLGADSARGRLWATAAAMPQGIGYRAADSGHAEVRRYDLASGALVKRYAVPPAATGPVPGDLTVAGNGDVFIGDGAAGRLYVIRATRDTLEVLVPAGSFRSAQQPALAADGRTLFVADYSRGIAAVDRTTGALRWLAHPRSAAIVGIDGLVRDGQYLIGVQNGVEPNRVVRFTLGSDGAVTQWALIEQGTPWLREPTHGVIVGGNLYVIANSGWNAFDDAGARRKDAPLDAPRILRIPLSPRQ